MTEIRKKFCSIYLFCSNFLPPKNGWKKVQFSTKISSPVFFSAFSERSWSAVILLAGRHIAYSAWENGLRLFSWGPEESPGRLTEFSFYKNEFLFCFGGIPDNSTFSPDLCSVIVHLHLNRYLSHYHFRIRII